MPDEVMMVGSVDAQTLVRGVEECLVTNDGTADATAKGVLDKVSDVIIEVVLCVEDVVAQEVVGGAMKCIRTGTGDDVDDCARVALPSVVYLSEQHAPWR